MARTGGLKGMAFQKGMQKVPGSGRKPGQATRRKLIEMLDGPEFKLKAHIQQAVASGDSKMVSSLSSLLRAISSFQNANDSAPKDIDELTEEQILALVKE